MENLETLSAVLPTRALIKEANPDIKIPRNYRGKSKQPYSVDLLTHVLETRQASLKTLLDTWEPAETPSGMDKGEAYLYHLGTDFYGVKSDKYAYYNYRITNGNAVDLGANLINFIYIEYFFPNRVAGIVSLLKNLTSSSNVTYHLPDVPPREDIESFMQVSTWARKENIYIKDDILWVFSKKWDMDKFIEVIASESFNLDKIEKLFFLGVDSLEEIYDMTVKNNLYMPDTWLNSMLEAAGWNERK